jgi:quercetin dioxygenase-like cupin family protein
MEIKRSGSQAPIKGAADNFTGDVQVEPLFQQKEPARAGAGRVTFQPGAHSAWHTHPLGQALVVTDGVGWTQCWGEPKVEFRAGDVITCPPGKKHWHGATPTTAMTHIAIQETLNGKNVEWLERVSDEQYLSPLGTK